MEMSLFAAALTLYGVAMFLFFGYAVTRREAAAATASGALLLGILAHLVFVILRTIAGHRLPGHAWYVPWSSWFESFSFLALVMAIQFALIERRRLPILGVFIVPIIFASMLMALRSPSGTAVPDLPGGLDSGWLAAHIPVMFVAYAAFGHAFAVGLAYLLQEAQLKSKNPTRLAFRLPPLEELDRLISRIIVWAFPALTLGLLLGARWAYDVWGRYWSWDAKETGALVTWMVYLGYLVMRSAAGWRGRKTAYLSLAGFAVVMFTYLGANHLSRMHAFLPGGGR